MLNELMVAVIIGEGHEQIERMAGGKQRSRRVLRRAHRGHRIIHQAAP